MSKLLIEEVWNSVCKQLFQFIFNRSASALLDSLPMTARTSFLKSAYIVFSHLGSHVKPRGIKGRPRQRRRSSIKCNSEAPLKDQYPCQVLNKRSLESSIEGTTLSACFRHFIPVQSRSDVPSIGAPGEQTRRF